MKSLDNFETGSKTGKPNQIFDLMTSQAAYRHGSRNIGVIGEKTSRYGGSTKKPELTKPFHTTKTRSCQSAPAPGRGSTTN